MPAPHAITPEKLSRLVGTAHCPRILDLRNAPERIIPGAVTGVQCGGATDKSVIVVDQEGGTMAIAAAAVLRSDGIAAETLEGGHAASNDLRGFYIADRSVFWIMRRVAKSCIISQMSPINR